MKDVALAIIAKLHIIVLNVLIGVIIPCIIIFSLTKKWVISWAEKKVSINE